MNCDQVVDEADVPQFVNALLSDTALPACDAYAVNVNGDVMADGAPKVDGGDIQPFVAAMTGV